MPRVPEAPARRSPRPSRARAPRATRRTYHHGDLRAALIDAAARMAAESGPTSVTLREVARRAGVSQAAPYHHFADKAALIAAVAEEGFRLFDVHQADALAAAPADPVERLGALGVSYLRFAMTQPHYFQVMFRPSLIAGDRPPDLERLSASAYARLVDTTVAARRACGRRDADPTAAVLAVWAIPHGLANICLEGSSRVSPELALLESIVRDAARALAGATFPTRAARR